MSVEPFLAEHPTDPIIAAFARKPKSHLSGFREYLFSRGSPRDPKKRVYSKVERELLRERHIQARYSRRTKYVPCKNENCGNEATSESVSGLCRPCAAKARGKYSGKRMRRSNSAENIARGIEQRAIRASMSGRKVAR